MKKYSLLNTLIGLLAKILLRLRYSIKIKGLDDIKSSGKSGVSQYYTVKKNRRS